ncbi:MAG: nucleotidyltransferase domain-containing protein [bacterium]
MPVRSLRSSVFKWPDGRTVDEAVRRWAASVVRRRQDVARIGYFGSYARGDWGVGSDLDLIIVVERSDQPFERRAAGWDATGLPVQADVLVYTTVWVYP